MKHAIETLVAGKDLSGAEMQDVIQTIMTGQADLAAVGSFLTALTMKGETVEEVTAAVKVMRDLAKHVTLDEHEVLVDPVGTGGDGASLFNCSTASAIIASAAGVKIAKHGNIAASSSSGSADLLREAGVKLDLTPEQVSASISECNFGFMFAQAYHSAMRYVVPARKAIGIRTVFNVLGPLSNPAGVKYQVLGVFSKAWLRPMVEVAKALESKHIIAVHAQNGLDEFSVTAKNDVCELNEVGEVREYVVDPEEFGLKHDSDAPLKVANPSESLALIKAIFAGEGPAVGRDMLALNTAAIFMVSNKVGSWEEGISLAKEMMTSGKASAQLARIAEVSQRLGAA